MTGILWLDDSSQPLAKKIGDAANCYRSRFGAPATLCYANPNDLAEPTVIGAIRVEPRRNVPRNHYLVGRDPVESVLERAA